MLFKKFLDESKRKINKTCVDKDSGFYNRSMKVFSHNHGIEMYSTHNGRKFIIAEGFIRTLKSKIYKYMTRVSKNVYIDKLDDIVNKYNNTYDSTTKKKLADVKSSTYINSSKEVDNRDPKFRIGDIVRISKYKNIFAKGCPPDWSEEVFVFKKVKSTVSWAFVISDINGEEIGGTSFKKEFQKTNQKEFWVEKVTKRKSNKLYVKWKGFDNSFNSCINKMILLHKSELYFTL